MSLSSHTKTPFTQVLIAAFSSYAEMYPALTAIILDKMIFPESNDLSETDMDEPDGFAVRLRKVVYLILILPENTASELLAQMRCLNDEEDPDFLDTFIFEMARIENFDTGLFSAALNDFTLLESASSFGGIDKARIIGENAFGTQRMLDCVNRLTESLIIASENPEQESGSH